MVDVSSMLACDTLTVVALPDSVTTLFCTVTGPDTAPPLLNGMLCTTTRTWLFCTTPVRVSRRCRLTATLPVVRPPPTRIFADPDVLVAKASYDVLGVTDTIWPVCEP